MVLLRLRLGLLLLLLLCALRHPALALALVSP